jgi:flagellar M-ring protein FliF
MPGFFARLNGNGRVLALSVAAVLLVAAVMLARRATTPSYVPLFRGLELTESGRMTEALGKAGIDYRLGGGGADISVPEADAARARVTLAQGGLPGSDRPGLELFDRPAWGMTDFTQHVTYRRALEGELARTIGTLRGVERAQVHLALPESSPLRKLDRPAEAAVVVALKPNGTLTTEQVRGIAQLVSSSVEQLTIDHVAVLDDSGRPLSGVPAAADDVSGLSSRQLEIQRGVETQLQTKVRDLLGAALGPDAVRVQVAARLNFDQVDRTIEAYDTSGAVLKTEQRSQAEPDSAVGGVASTVLSNEYLNSRTVDRIIGSVGGVTRLTVSALVDSRALGSDGTLQDADRERYAGVIRDAIGYDESRGDRVSVVAIPFNGAVAATPVITSPEQLESTSGPGAIELASRFAYPLLALLALVIAAVIGFKAVAGIARPAAPALGEGRAAGELGRQPTVAPLRTATSHDGIAPPESSARVLRNWMAEPTA